MSIVNGDLLVETEVYANMAIEQERHWWFRARSEILSQLIEQIGLGTGARILEIGCGTGANLKMLAKFGEVSAIENDEYARELATETTGIQVIEGELPGGLENLKDKFDLICLFDVLEHVERDAEALSRVKQLLSADGCIIITVPAYQWLFGRHDLEHHHYRRYIKRDIGALSSKAGLEVSKTGYFNTLLFPLVVLVRITDKGRSGGRSTGSAIPANVINELFYQIFRLEKIILQYITFPFGASIYSVLKDE